MNHQTVHSLYLLCYHRPQTWMHCVKYTLLHTTTMQIIYMYITPPYLEYTQEYFLAAMIFIESTCTPRCVGESEKQRSNRSVYESLHLYI